MVLFHRRLSCFLHPQVPARLLRAGASHKLHLGETKKPLVELFLRPAYALDDWQNGCD